jgi:uncharacterized protein YndB with AHSA1/START domain
VTSRILVAVRVAATPERTFEAFTREIGLWWKPNSLFAFDRNRSGRLAFEPGPAGRLIETYDDGTMLEIGRITVWRPPHELAFGWRQASFSSDQTTEVRVTFERAGSETRVTVQHFGWDSLPRGHAARHSFPLDVFQTRHAEWWQTLLRSLGARL